MTIASKKRPLKHKYLLMLLAASMVLLAVVASFPPFINRAQAASGSISMDVRDADIRDVLSALALQTGSTLILDAQPINITFKAQNVSPAKALELLIQSQGLASLQQGNLIVVGSPNKLQESYFNQMILTRFDLRFVTAEQLKGLIGELGVPAKVLTIDTNSNVLWVQGNAQSLQKVREAVSAVDSAENTSGSALLDYRTVTTNQISPTRVVELLAQAGIIITKYVEYSNQLLVFDKNLFPRWTEVETLMAQLDSASARKEKTFVYKLENISAKDAAERLKLFDFGEGNEVKTINYNNANYGRELLVICPPHVESLVRSALDSLDSAQTDTRVPLITQTGDNAYDSLYAIRALLSELTDVSKESMHISRNLSGDSGSPAYILWVEESPDKVQVLLDLVESMPGPAAATND